MEDLGVRLWQLALTQYIEGQHKSKVGDRTFSPS